VQKLFERQNQYRRAEENINASDVHSRWRVAESVLLRVIQESDESVGIVCNWIFRGNSRPSSQLDQRIAGRPLAEAQMVSPGHENSQRMRLGAEYPLLFAIALQLPRRLLRRIS
jgi:hypothetical protein